METLINKILDVMQLEKKSDLTLEQERKMLTILNEFQFTNTSDIGNTHILGENLEYVSEYHKYWEERHENLLNPTIDNQKCELIADIFHDIYIQYSDRAFYTIYDKKGLSNEAVCQVRYFSASQDFKTSFDIEKLLKLYKRKPYLFEKNFVYENPERFLKETGLTMDQREKRIRFLKESAKLLIDNDIEAIQLLDICNQDVLKVKALFLNHKGLGIKEKKADMFIRDMIVLGIWNNVKNFESIGVASDTNTMKVALRTGILKTEIPLVSSLLDVFDYQHDLIYKMNEQAWRTVWEIWKGKYPKESIESPCLMDYIIYKIIGKEFCKENMFLFHCNDCQEKFVTKSKSTKKCRICKQTDISFIKKSLPCTHSKGEEVIKTNATLSKHDIYKNYLECPFASVCHAKSEDFIKYNPPKTISIKGSSGWDRARVRAKEGGGGITA